MPSLFEKITRVVVQEMDTGGDMIAVRSIVEADRYHCFCLVREKRNLLGRRYYSTDLTLEDILEREESEGQLDKLDSGFQGRKAEFQVVDVVDSKGMLTVTLPKEITIPRAFHGSQEQRIQILETRVSQQYLNSLENRRLKRKLPSSFRSIQTMREDLYLVTETVETARQETLKSEQKYAFWSHLDFYSLKYEHKHHRAVTIPTKQVLGYGIKQLVFPNMERMKICFSSKTKSFPEEKDGLSCHPGKNGGHLCPGLRHPLTLEPSGFKDCSSGESLSMEDVRNMKEKVQDTVRGLQDLTEEERKDVLSCLTKCLLIEDEELQDLEQRVSEVLIASEPQMEGTAGALIRSLFNAAGILVEARTEAILGFLDALMELSEEKELVAEALEKGTLALLKEQVESTLEQHWGEQPRDVGCEPEAQILRALYVSASILLQLSETPASVSS
ncbi:gasdermin-B isoform X1 [Rhinolophus sinicus]|uniref:gasdermin-B isoform X1 n=2 Tax=Rhinolophus sinicus TaxID=89399 RepID=UPI003D7A5A8F